MADILSSEIKARIEKYLTDPSIQSLSHDEKALQKIKTNFPAMKTRLRLKLGEVCDDLETFYSMLYDTSFALDERSRTTLVAVMIYFLDPFDFLPQGAPLVGLVDDRLVIACAAQACRSEVDRFTSSGGRSQA